MAIVILCPLVAAEVPHENFDKAEMNLAILEYYIDMALSEMNYTLSYILQDDPDGVLLHSGNYTKLVKNAVDTMNVIPSGVDSYQYFKTYVEGLNSTVNSLSDLVSGFDRVLGSLYVYNSYNMSVWNLTSIRENLTGIDSALISFDTGISLMRSGSGSLGYDLLDLASNELDVAAQIDKTDKIIDHIEELRLKDMDAGDVVGVLMGFLMPHWAKSIDDLVEENEPDEELGNRLGILDLVIPDLESGLAALLPGPVDDLKYADGGIEIFSSNQIAFISSISKLENISVDRMDVIEQYAELIKARSSFILLEEELSGQWSCYAILKGHDQCGVKTDLDNLTDLVDEYRDRLNRIGLIMDDINRLATLCSETLWSNLIDADTDSSGEISFREMKSLSLGDVPFGKIDKMNEVESLIEKNIDMIGYPYRENLDLLFQPVKRTVSSTSDFTGIHDSFHAEIIKIDTETSTGNRDQDIFHFIRSINQYIDMRQQLALAEERANIVFLSEVDMDLSSFDPLFALMDQYRDLLERLAELLNQSGVFIETDEEVVPYDYELRFFGLLFIEDYTGNMIMPDHEEVHISFGGESLAVFETDKGIFSGSIPITRDLSLGPHIVNASYEDDWDEAVFSVRKITTNLTLYSDDTYVDPLEEVSVSVKVKDEFLRSTSGQLAYNDTEINFDGDGEILCSFDLFGEFEFTVEFTESRYFSGSFDSIVFNVSYDPDISLDFDATILLYGEELCGRVNLSLGEGEVEIDIGDVEIREGYMKEGETRSILLNTTSLGLGFFTARAHLESHVIRSRDGYSLPVTILVIRSWEDLENITEEYGKEFDEDEYDKDGYDKEGYDREGYDKEGYDREGYDREGYDKEGYDEEGYDKEGYDKEGYDREGNKKADDETDDEDTEDDSDDNPWMDPTYLIPVILFLVFVLSLTFAIIKVRKRTRDLEKDAPGVVIAKVEEEISERKRFAPRRIRFPNVAPEETGLYLDEETVDPNRTAIIETYLDMIYRAPEWIRIERSDTPREILAEINRSGIGGDKPDRLLETLEKVVYTNAVPDDKVVKLFREDAKYVLSRFEQIP